MNNKESLMSSSDGQAGLRPRTGEEDKGKIRLGSGDASGARSSELMISWTELGELNLLIFPDFVLVGWWAKPVEWAKANC